jgi:hypothetical protein
MTKLKEDFNSYIKRRQKEVDEQEATSKQVGGDHYKDCKIQPVEYIHSNELDFFEGNIVKYITRHRKKGSGSQDIRKVIHYAELILELEYNELP